MTILRQLLYPREYRIDRSSLPENIARQIAQLISTLDTLKSGFSGAQRAQTEPAMRHIQSALADVGTNLWRMQKEVEKRSSNEEVASKRSIGRHLQAAQDALAEMGIEILDHTGERIPDKGAVGLKRLAFEPQEDLEHEAVLETIKPTILFRGRQIQMGEVIVGIPKHKGPSA